MFDIWSKYPCKILNKHPHGWTNFNQVRQYGKILNNNPSYEKTMFRRNMSIHFAIKRFFRKYDKNRTTYFWIDACFYVENIRFHFHMVYIRCCQENRIHAENGPGYIFNFRGKPFRDFSKVRNKWVPSKSVGDIFTSQPRLQLKIFA